MKKMLISLVLAFAILAAPSISAQDTTGVQSYKFAGMRYDDDYIGTIGFTTPTGIKLPIIGELVSYNYGDWGEDQSLSSELGFMFNVGSVLKGLGIGSSGFLDKLSLSPLFGPNLDIVGAGEEDGSSTSYLSLASGGLAAYALGEHGGVWVGGKRKIPLNEDNGFFASVVWGGGVYWGM